MIDPESQFALYEYATPDGEFDYDQYVENQVQATSRKLHRRWVRARTIETICRYLVQRIPEPEFGLCHGTRNGTEQGFFKDHLPGCRVLGTEISPTARGFPDTIQWDFHDLRPEWRYAADFVYSNSLDHAYDPELAVTRWVQSLRQPGYCFIEWWGTDGCREAVPVDCFSASVESLEGLLSQWGERARFTIADVLTEIRSRKKGLRPGRDGKVFVLTRNSL